ncbi:hypothetical protein BOTCAL_0094g00160 [Botryotinia calthae]|uniref:PXA domain-containing protein n=1 Tax=Botryotinia calthae TaxID=38488 RepID=A0A4Y8D994_9HELO|nr:hypothetical protein BOTCAL_0094g00160 [Botryotinia calthae]
MLTMDSTNESKVAEVATDDHITTRLLRFISTASTEQLLLAALALAFGTYIIFDGLFLLLLGALGGVVLHTVFTEKSALAVREEAVKPKDIQYELIEAGAGINFQSFRPKTATALNDLVEAVIRNYVKHWYSPILPNDEAFPIAAKSTLTRFILSMSQRLSRKRPADTFLDFLTNSSSITIVFLNELANATSATPGTSRSVGEMVTAYLSANPDSSLANIMNERQQKIKFTMAADDLLRSFLEKSVYESGPARIFLREILAGVVLEMTLKSCSKPEFINGWIVHLLEDGEPGLGQAIDEAMDRRNIHDPFSDIDGNVRNISIARSPKKQGHQRRITDEDATNEAMAEAKRLSMLIAAEDAKKLAQTDNFKDEENKVLDDQNAKENIQPESVLVSPTNGIPPHTPITDSRSSLSGSDANGRFPMSPDSKQAISPTTPQTTSSFTSFDQIVPPTPAALYSNETSPQRSKPAPLTLHNANIIIYDDSIASDKARIKSKPIMDYMVQIEPQSSIYPGWMIVRRYSDFEILHEVLGRIAKVSGANTFIEKHQDLPNWKSLTKPLLRGELEQYLKDALTHQPLAETEGMKRFLEKDQGTMPATATKAGFNWPTSSLENMGKGMFDTLKSAPKGAAAGVTGVFSNIGSLAQKRASQSSLQSQNRVSTPALSKVDSMASQSSLQSQNRNSTPVLSRVDSMASSNGSSFEQKRGRLSEESMKAASVISHPGKTASLGRRLSRGSIPGDEEESGIRTRGSSVSSHMSTAYSPSNSREPSQTPSTSKLHLPPPPTEMPDDYTTPIDRSLNNSVLENENRGAITAPNEENPTPIDKPLHQDVLSNDNSVAPTPENEKKPALTLKSLNQDILGSDNNKTPLLSKEKKIAPLNEEETKVAIELLFAIITELYTLSSAWNFRRTLLTAAKTFLLRPGNPSLSSIQGLLQESVISAYTSDAGIASSIQKLRENGLPTEAELKAWPEEMTAENKEKLKTKARKLLLERGMPIALMGVMGQAATGEALGKVFDALQREDIARGLVFGLLLQGIKAITQ